MGSVPAPPPHISVAVGVTVGLLASLVQSLGLTIQRKSHLANEALPPNERLRDWKRPLWLTGFGIFISSNLFGTVFQIGALPIVVLGPLGAVSLLWNAFFARFILGDQFSVYLAAGTVLIAGGAVIIGIFGVVPEVTHSLDELVRLYRRPPFIIWLSLLFAALGSVMVIAHFAEWALERRIARLYPTAPPLTPRPTSAHHRSHRKRTWSVPPRPRPAVNGKVDGDSMAALNGENLHDARYGTFESDVPRRRSKAGPEAFDDVIGEGDQSEESVMNLPSLSARKAPDMRIDIGIETEEDRTATDASCAAIERSRLVLGVAYGSVSGCLSGLCLLFAKTGVELLILTVVGQNQFGRIEAWLIVLVLLVGALLQLAYLNRALRLVGPTLVCPLAFCFYNISSIVSGVIYYDQFDQLSSLQIGLVTLGTAVLLAGVWIVSIKVDPVKAGDDLIGGHAGAESVPLLVDEPESYSDDEYSRPALRDNEALEGNIFTESETEDDEPLEWLPRGLTIGLGAASPGFDIRPAHRSHQRHHPRLTHRRSVSLTHARAGIDTSSRLTLSPNEPPPVITPLAHTGDEVDGTGLLDRTASEADVSSAATEVDRRRAWREQRHHHHHHHRGISLSGALYVGRRDSGPPVPNALGRSLSSGAGAGDRASQPEAQDSPRRSPRGMTPVDDQGPRHS